MAAIGDLPEEIIVEVLSQVPSWDVVCSCRFVCSQWRDVADSLNAQWKLKCKQEAFAMPDCAIQDWKAFYFLSSAKRNLIQNACGKEGLNFWGIGPHQNDAWDTGPLSGFPLEHVTSGFGAFSGPDPKSQLITLKDHGYSDELMDHIKPAIVVKDWTDVFDPYIYTLNVQLLSADHQVLCQCHTENVDVVEDKEEIWSEVSYTFWNYPSGVRHVLFQHGVSGVDSGSLTNSSVTVGPNFPTLGSRCGGTFQGKTDTGIAGK
ncbi:F-box only protein 44-like [Elgaria multicarinata webbii]|uniref:F-box only protein 44-like n=1 Tax=Elgaria multicarinata webbii TaxID=159646 RepID=UPI002FCCE8BD